MGARELDVVLFGGSGFTGRLVARRLLERAPQGTRIGLAGRSIARLAAVRDALGPGAAAWPLIEAEASDDASVARVAGSATAVATTVGPYSRHGLPLVVACARAGTHYCDLTGEVLFMRASIDACHAPAQQSGARIVHACGFDSIPSDLGVLLLSGAAGGLGGTTMVVREARGGVSGGTIASMREQMVSARGDATARRLLADPYALSPDRRGEPDGSGDGDSRGPVHDAELGWVAPFFMGSVNTRVVRRSNALAGFAYSRRFRYREVMAFGEGPAGAARAAAVSAGLVLGAGAMSLAPGRWVLDRALPRPGEGPDEATRSSGRFRIEIRGQALDGGRHVATVAADEDPGYASTSLMLAESVLLAAVVDPGIPDRAGVLTPATAFGMPLITRLRAAGMRFEVGPRPEVGPPFRGERSRDGGRSRGGGGSRDVGRSRDGGQSDGDQEQA